MKEFRYRDLRLAAERRCLSLIRPGPGWVGWSRRSMGLDASSCSPDHECELRYPENSSLFPALTWPLMEPSVNSPASDPLFSQGRLSRSAG